MQPAQLLVAWPGCLAWLAVKIHAGLGRDPYTRDWRIEWLTRWGTDPSDSRHVRKSPAQLSVESQYEFDTGCTWPFFFHPSSHPPFSPHMKTFGTTFCRIEVRILRTLYMAIFFFHWIHPSLLSPYKIQNTSNTYNDHNQASKQQHIHLFTVTLWLNWSYTMSSSTVSSILLLIRLHLQYIQEHIYIVPSNRYPSGSSQWKRSRVQIGKYNLTTVRREDKYRNTIRNQKTDIICTFN